jgi:hypothetical protein
VCKEKMATRDADGSAGHLLWTCRTIIAGREKKSIESNNLFLCTTRLYKLNRLFRMT